MKHLLTLEVLLLVSCGGSTLPQSHANTEAASPTVDSPDRVPIAAVPAYGNLTANTEFLRIRIAGTVANPRIESAEAVVLPAGSVRPVRLGGELALVSYAGDSPLEIRFADLSTTVAYEVKVGEVSVTVQNQAGESSCELFVVRDPSLTRLALMRGEETIVSTAVADLRNEAPGKLGNTPFLQVSGASGSPTVPGYPHIRILGPGEDAQLPLSFRTDGWSDHEGNPLFENIAEPTAAYVDYFRRGFELVQPEVAATVRAVAIVNLRGAGRTSLPASACPETSSGTPRVNGGSKVGVFLINSYSVDEDRNGALGTLVHETAHVFQEAIDSIAAQGSGWEFIFPEIDSFARSRRILIPFLKPHDPPAANASAERDTYNFGIWEHTHNSAVEAGFARAMTTQMDRAVGDTIPGPDFWLPRYCTTAEAIAAGHPTIYGASKPEEDIADFVAAIQFDPEHSPVCVHIRSGMDPDHIPSRVLLHVAKASILRQAGFVSDENYQTCVGPILRTTSPGINLRRETGAALFMGSAVEAGFGQMDGKKYFRVTATDEASTYAGLFTIYTPRYVTPVGLHRLNTEGFGLRGFQNEFLLNHENDLSRRASAGGLVLITEALDGEVRGALIQVPLRNLLGIRSRLDYAPFWVRGN